MTDPDAEGVFDYYEMPFEPLPDGIMWSKKQGRYVGKMYNGKFPEWA